MNGIDCFMEGFRLVTKPGLRRYVIIPTLINAIVLALMIVVSINEFSPWVEYLISFLPGWLSFLSWLIWVFASLIVAFILFYLFTIVANIIASPFNALLSIKVEESLIGRSLASTVSLWMILPRAIMREFSKLMYLLPRLIALLLISVIPVVNAAAPFLWIIFSAWMMAVQYADYAADNNEISFSELRKRLAGKRFESILFGFPAYLMLAIPFVNLVLLPVAVAGGTVFWVKNLR